MAAETIPLPMTPEGTNNVDNSFDLAFEAGRVAAAASAAFETRDTSVVAIRNREDETKAFICGATDNTCGSCYETDCATCRCSGISCACGE